MHVVSFVFDPPDLGKRCILWSFFSQTALYMSDSWIVLGDFNQVLHLHGFEKLRGNKNLPISVHFADFIYSFNMIDIIPYGIWFTCSNGRVGVDSWERLDREICNVQWLIAFPKTKVDCLPILCLDHSRVFVNCELKLPFKSRPFRFGYMWLAEDQCREIVLNV